MALAAQGFADPRPGGRVEARHFRRVLDRVAAVQLDAVNVVARAHELAFLARLGPYSRHALGEWLWGRRGVRTEVVEYWAHEASLVPVAHHRLFRWRMSRPHAWGSVAELARRRPDLIEAVRRAALERGPIRLRALDHLAADHRRSSSAMWARSDAKKAAEWLFWTGRLMAVRDPLSFERAYLAPEALLGPLAHEGHAPAEAEAQRALVVLAARAHGVATARDLADYHRLDVRTARARIEEAVANGELRRVRVQGWKADAFLHPSARLPRAVSARALLSPFDSLVWSRGRAQDLFGFRYRAEMYVPHAARVHGYYVLPFLLGETLVARVDCKADRRGGALVVRAAFLEPGAPAARVAAGLAAALVEVAEFCDLAEVVVEGRGDLAGTLARAVSAL